MLSILGVPKLFWFLKFALFETGINKDIFLYFTLVSTWPDEWHAESMDISSLLWDVPSAMAFS